MTEAEWVVSTNPDELLKYLSCKRQLAMIRKLRLFCCGCCRRIWHLLSDERSRKAVEVAEQFADGLTTLTMLKAAESLPKKWEGNNWFQHNARIEAPAHAAQIGFRTDKMSVANTAKVASMTADACVGAVTGDCADWHGGSGTWEDRIRAGWSADSLTERREQTRLLRCIFGNPFRPVMADSTWRTTNVVALAQAIYEERAFDRLPVLADALEDAGCTNEAVLGHCHGSGPHARGCWVVDLLLGKE